MSQIPFSRFDTMLKINIFTIIFSLKTTNKMEVCCYDYYNKEIKSKLLVGTNQFSLKSLTCNHEKAEKYVRCVTRSNRHMHFVTNLHVIIFSIFVI